MEVIDDDALLDRQAAADAVVDARARLLRVEAERLRLAAHWADLHAEEADVADGEPRLAGAANGSGARAARVLPGSERFVLVGGDGTPEVGEFAASELAVLMQVSLAAAASMMADALDLRHRLPSMWASVQSGRIEAWKARKVAARVRAVGLSQSQALWIDLQISPYADSLPWSRLCDRLEGKIIEVDPEAADQRRQAAALDRFVRTGRSSELGLTTIVARAAAGHAIFFVAMCDRLAQILELEGDADPVDVRRSKAIGILADPARALAMLQRHAAVEGAHPPLEEHRVNAESLPLTSATAENASIDVVPMPNTSPTPMPRPSFGTSCGTCGAVASDATSFVRPMKVDPAKLRPAATLFVHTSREAWERRQTGGLAGGVARVEGVGAVTLAQAVELLGHADVTVREVIDLAEDRSVDAYEVPDRIREVLIQRSPATAFPWGGPATRHHDADHTVPYLSPDKGGTPGQTRIGNLGFLSRSAHRVKTHAPGWRHHQPRPGVHLWRTPSGYWFRVDHAGSHALGRGSADPPTSRRPPDWPPDRQPEEPPNPDAPPAPRHRFGPPPSVE